MPPAEPVNIPYPPPAPEWAVPSGDQGQWASEEQAPAPGGTRTTSPLAQASKRALHESFRALQRFAAGRATVECLRDAAAPGATSRYTNAGETTCIADPTQAEAVLRVLAEARTKNVRASSTEPRRVGPVGLVTTAAAACRCSGLRFGARARWRQRRGAGAADRLMDACARCG